MIFFFGRPGAMRRRRAPGVAALRALHQRLTALPYACLAQDGGKATILIINC